MIYGLCLDTLKELKMTAWLCSVSPSLDDTAVCKTESIPAATRGTIPLRQPYTRLSSAATGYV